MSEKFRIGGETISLSRQDVEERLRNVRPEDVRDLSVSVNGLRYPVKQALVCASGLLRGNFTSHEAMRVFRRLGFALNADSAVSRNAAQPQSIFDTTEELLCPECKKPFVFRVGRQQTVFEGCSCPKPKPLENVPPGAIIWWIGTNGIGFLRVPRKSA